MTLLLLAITLSLDSFFTSITYSINHIKISKIAALILSSIGTFLLGIALFCSSILRTSLSSSVCIFSSFFILCAMGCYRLFEPIFKKKIKDQSNLFMQIYKDEVNADIDHSKELSITESIFLGIALSLDSLASGIGIGLSEYNPIMLLLLTFFITFILIEFGYVLGRKLFQNCPNLNWISGVLLILLAFLRLVA